MKPSYWAVLGTYLFFAGTLGIAIYFSAYFPARVIIGESSVGTWISGTLLTICATLCLVMAMQGNWWPWSPLAIFFMILALDERFMFHEQLKERIIFSIGTTTRWVYELPVIAGALAGTGVAYVLGQKLTKTGRFFLIVAATLGALSVLIDVLAASVIWEECLKLLAEFAVTGVLIGQAARR